MVRGPSLRRRPPGDFRRVRKARVGRAAPRAANATDTSFRSKRVRVAEQRGVVQDGGGGSANVNVGELVSLTSHPAARAREDALRRLGGMGRAAWEVGPQLALASRDEDGGVRRAWGGLVAAWVRADADGARAVARGVVLNEVAVLAGGGGADARLDAAEVMEGALAGVLDEVLDVASPGRILALVVDLARSVLGTSSSSLTKGLQVASTQHHRQQQGRGRAGVLASFKAQQEADALAKKKKRGESSGARAAKAEVSTNVSRVFRVSRVLCKVLRRLQALDEDHHHHVPSTPQQLLEQAALVSVELLRHMCMNDHERIHVASECVVLALECCFRATVVDDPEDNVITRVAMQARDLFHEFSTASDSGASSHSVWSVRVALCAMRLDADEASAWLQVELDWLAGVLTRKGEWESAALSATTPDLDLVVMEVLTSEDVPLPLKQGVMDAFLDVVQRTWVAAPVLALVSRSLDVLNALLEDHTEWTDDVRVTALLTTQLPKTLWSMKSPPPPAPASAAAAAAAGRVQAAEDSDEDDDHDNAIQDVSLGAVVSVACQVLARFVRERISPDSAVVLAKNLAPLFFAFTRTNGSAVPGPWCTSPDWDEDARRDLCGVIACLPLRSLPSNLLRSLAAAVVHGSGGAAACVELPFLFRGSPPNDDNTDPWEFTLASFACTVALRSRLPVAREMALTRLLAVLDEFPGLVSAVEEGFLQALMSSSSSFVALRCAARLVGYSPTGTSESFRTAVLEALVRAWTHVGSAPQSGDGELVGLAMRDLCAVPAMQRPRGGPLASEAVKGLLEVQARFDCGGEGGCWSAFVQ